MSVEKIKEDGEKSFDQIKESLLEDPIVKAFLTSTAFNHSYYSKHIDEQKDVLTFNFRDTHCLTIVKYSDYRFFVQEMGIGLFEKRNEEDSCWDHESFDLPKYWDRDAIEIIIRKIANRFKEHVSFDLYYSKSLKNLNDFKKWKQVPKFSTCLDNIVFEIKSLFSSRTAVGLSYKERVKLPTSNDNVAYALVVSGVENPSENMIRLELGQDVFAAFYKLK